MHHEHYSRSCNLQPNGTSEKNIRCLQQNKPISSIVIVNNGSTDGTTEWLAAQEGLTVINQTNVGGAGGFYTGIQYAYQAGADWIWCMDDDVFPRADCLEQLLPYTDKKISAYWPLAGCSKEKYSPHDFQAYNLSNPFVSTVQQETGRTAHHLTDRNYGNSFRRSVHPPRSR